MTPYEDTSTPSGRRQYIRAVAALEALDRLAERLATGAAGRRTL